jgi:hypothetical protein
MGCCKCCGALHLLQDRLTGLLQIFRCSAPSDAPQLQRSSEKFVAAELRNICSKIADYFIERCRAPEYSTLFMKVLEKFKDIFIFKFNFISY